MSDISSRLELLPNEILIYIFQFFDARDLFRAFYNLNIRFNTLLQSLNYLSLTLLKFNSNEIKDYDILAPFIYTLKMDYAVNIDLKYFMNIHRLILLSPTSNQLKQAVFTSLPYLEHLSIGYEHFLFSYYIDDICRKIFSNNFPCLKSCYLFEPRVLEIIPNLTQSTQIRILKMDNIDILIYKDILSLCPNLCLFQFTISNQSEEICHINPHLNLKRMIIKFQSLIKTFSDSIMMSYLSCVPNLEQFHIYEINFDVNIKEYINYNWFATLINHHLLLLDRFKYYLYIYEMKESNEDIINHIKRTFQYIHRDRYQSRLILYRSLDKMKNSKLEYLPNELLLDIFEYIDLRDLFNGFWGLNKRMNHLIRSVKNLSFNLERYEPVLISLFANQINRLIVNTWQDIDLRQFSSLQSLILHQITGNQLRQIRSEFMPYLVYLSTSSIPEFSLMPQLAQRIFSNEMPSIEHVDLGQVHVPYLRTWSQSPSLSSVSVHCTNPTIIPFILLSSPNLIYLHVHFLYDTISIFDHPPMIINHPLKQFHLSDPYHKLSFNNIYTILSFIPNLRKIQLNFLCKIPFIRFIQSLVNRLQYLKRFDCNIDDVSNDKTTMIETIRQIHRCFYRIQCSINDLNFRTFITE